MSPKQLPYCASENIQTHRDVTEYRYVHEYVTNLSHVVLTTE